MPPRPVTCLLVLSFLFISSYYLGHCSFSPWYSHSGNWNCTRLFVDCLYCNVTELLWRKNCIVKLYSRERLFVERMHQKKTNAETLCKIWFAPFVPWLPSSMSIHDGKWGKLIIYMPFAWLSIIYIDSFIQMEDYEVIISVLVFQIIVFVRCVFHCSFLMLFVRRWIATPKTVC